MCDTVYRTTVLSCDIIYHVTLIFDTDIFYNLQALAANILLYLFTFLHFYNTVANNNIILDIIITSVNIRLPICHQRRHISIAGKHVGAVCRNVIRPSLQLSSVYCYTGVVWRTSLYFYPAPDRGTGYCFRSISFFLSFFLSLFLCQQGYEKTAGPICMKFSEKVWSDHGTT